MVEKKNKILAISVWLAISIIIDYTCTLWFSGSIENLINNEHSLLLIQVVKHEMLIPYALVMMGLYFSCSYLALHTLKNHKIFPVALLSIALIAIAHSFAGISWYVKSALYTNMIFTFLAISFGLMIFCFAYLVIWKTPAPATHS